MKVGDYVEVAGDIFYVTRDITPADVNFCEFAAIAVYTKELPVEQMHVGKISKIAYGKGSSGPHVVKPIFIRE
jgi:hypothetical protein